MKNTIRLVTHPSNALAARERPHNRQTWGGKLTISTGGNSIFSVTRGSFMGRAMEVFDDVSRRENPSASLCSPASLTGATSQTATPS